MLEEEEEERKKSASEGGDASAAADAAAVAGAKVSRAGFFPRFARSSAPQASVDLLRVVTNRIDQGPHVLSFSLVQPHVSASLVLFPKIIHLVPLAVPR